MASIVIIELETNTELNRNAMSNIVGGTDPTRSRALANELVFDDSAELESIPTAVANCRVAKIDSFTLKQSVIR